MKYYSDKHINLLRHLASHDYVTVDDVNRADCQFLYKEGFITMGYDSSLPNRPYVSRISEGGIAYLATLDHAIKYEDENIKLSKASNRIAFAALIVAIVALIKSFGIVGIIIQLLI